VRLAPSALLVFPTGGDREFGRELQERAVRDLERVTDTGTLAPSALSIVPVTAVGVQFVGLNVKSGRLTFTLTCLICKGMPSMIVGIANGEPDGSVVIVNAAVMRVDFDLRADDDRPAFLQVERAGLRGVHDREAERGALIRAGDVDTFTTRDVNGSPPTPTETIVSPISTFRAARAGVRFGFAAELHTRRADRRGRRGSAA
jgi:hypothetical protein